MIFARTPPSSTLPRHLGLASMVGIIALISWWIGGWVLREAAGRHLADVTGVPVSLSGVGVGLFPPAINLERLSVGPVSGGHRSMLVIGKVRAELDYPSGVVWPPAIARLDIEDVSVAPVSVMDQAARMPSPERHGVGPWDRPGYGQLPDEVSLDAAIAGRSLGVGREVEQFRRDLRARLTVWRRWMADAPLEGKVVVAQRIRADWGVLQARHEQLLLAAHEAAESLLYEWGLSEEAWAEEATLLTDDRILGVLQSGLGLRGLLGWTQRGSESEATHRLPPIRRVVFSGRLWQGGREGRLHGEMLNAGGHLEAAAPTTLTLEAQGDRLGTLKLTAALEPLVATSRRDTLTLSWQNMRFDTLRWVDRPLVDVVLGDARLSLDISGSLSVDGSLDIAVREVWSAGSVEVVGNGPDLELLESLASILQAKPDITVSAIIDGTVREPEIEVNSEVRDMLLTLIRERRGPAATPFRAVLEARMQSAFGPLVSLAEPELLAVTAFMNTLPGPVHRGSPILQTPPSRE